MPTNQDGLIVSPKYVYLDWNSFACARDSEHPLHEVFVQAINTAKEQGVHFPFSEAHIRDLFTKSRFTENEHTEKKVVSRIFRTFSNSQFSGKIEKSGLVLDDVLVETFHGETPWASCPV